MARKAKVKDSRKPTRGLGYLSVISLVAAALIIGAVHEPLKEWVGSLTQSLVPPTMAPIENVIVLAPDVPELDKPQHIKSVIMSETDLSVLKVTIADSTRIEYILEPASIGVDPSQRRAIFALTCALQTAGPARRAVVFVGVGRYVDSAGQPALRSRAETKLSSLQLNRMKCAPEISERDIDWKRVAEYDIRFAIPRGFKVDF